MIEAEAKDLLDKYIASWLSQDKKLFLELLADTIVYSECYGPIYSNKTECEQWFEDWNKDSKVIQWNITDFAFDSKNNKIAFEWFFECNYKGEIASFNGASFMRVFNNQFITINEYKTESEHYFPYKLEITAEEKLTDLETNEIQQLYELCNTNDETKYSFDENSDFQREDEINTFFVCNNNKIGAALTIFAPTKKEAEVTALTLPSERGKGYFTELKKCLIKELHKRKIDSILYVCDEKSILGKKVINHIGAEYEFSEYLMKYNKINDKLNSASTITIEAAKVIDLNKYIEINSKAFKNEKEDTTEIIKEFFNSEKRTLYGVVYKNEIVGMIGIYEEENRNYIYGFCIDPKYQKRGIGKWVLNEIAHICLSKNDGKEIVLEVQTKNLNALNTYKNGGFKIETEFQYYRKNLYEEN